MPTRWRSCRRSVSGALTVMPSNRMRPSWIGSRPLMQRSIVLLPEPDRPITAMISPGSMASETPSSTVLRPKRLTTFCSSTRGTQPPFQTAAELGQREAHGEVDRCHHDIDGEGTKGRSVGELAFAGQLDETDHGGERGVLDELHQEADGGRNGNAHRLWHDDIAQLLA